MGSARSREGLVDLCPWLLLWASVIGIFWFISKQQPFDMADLFSSFQELSTNSTDRQQTIVPPISGTAIRGNSVVSFHNHLRCMSESGRWVYNATPRHIPWDYVAENYTDRCDQEHVGLKGRDAEQPFLTPQNWTVREELKWVWRTNETCRIEPVDRDEFCKLIGSARGNVMVVGDSINHGFQWSITNNLIKDPNAQKLIKEGYPVCKVCPGFRICDDVLGRGGGFNVSFIRNDRISMTGKARYEHGGRFIERPWTDYIKKWKVKILILNRGAHYEADEVVLKALNSTFSYLRKRHPQLLVFVRNTPPAVFCDALLLIRITLEF
ncbi:uncharacterized protein LOC116266621 isoform X2 [Nymphaea colorata]|uniref:uncharacterized protein LOC116266621 isoform X2 n=1 Tax=Nymphaea colorata TaxID=210225 RepID=UPI00129E6A1B|nr:uncharacterized protein LOC116266621 isoform X2 [Nymphaea colorata]